MKKKPKAQIPEEFENVAFTSDVNALEERMDQCYSAERYEEFQEAVEKIVLRKLDSSDGGEKIKKYAEDYFKSKVIFVILIWLISAIGAILIQIRITKITLLLK